MNVKDQHTTENYAIYNGDCCEVIKDIPDESIGCSIFSPPFANLYSYSDSDQDMSNSKTREEFFDHFSFLIGELHRILMPGRVIAAHVMDMPVLKSNTGYTSIWDFPGDVIRCFEKHDFLFHSRVCIWKDPLLAAVRTKAIGLAHKQIVKDSSICRTGLADYVLAFRKKGDNETPLANPDGLTVYHGARTIPEKLDGFIGHKIQGTNKRSHWIWQQYASPVWMDIRQTNVLPHREAREDDDQKHICPLQLDVIERCIALWSTEGDTVLTPFLGVGSEAYVAVQNNRKAIGIELKESYYRQAVQNLKLAESSKASQQMDLFSGDE